MWLWLHCSGGAPKLSAHTGAMQPSAHGWEPGERDPRAAGGHGVAEHNTLHCSAPLTPSGPRATIPNPTGERRWGWCVQRLCIAPESRVAKVLHLSFRRTANSTKPDSWIMWACLDYRDKWQKMEFRPYSGVFLPQKGRFPAGQPKRPSHRQRGENTGPNCHVLSSEIQPCVEYSKFEENLKTDTLVKPCTLKSPLLEWFC